MEKLRGVNFGGWIVLERWMTPSLFSGTDAKDEYTFMQTSGAWEKIEQHRKSFITEEDFRWLSKNGLNAVRIPVGYWIFDGDGPFAPAITYLDFAMKMAKKYKLKVLIDLHGVKGSQNGNDHSGKIGPSDWYWNRTYRQETLELLERLIRRYENSPALWGIELLNEPNLGPIKFFILRRFYREAYRHLSGMAKPGLRIVFSDAFLPSVFSGVIKGTSKWPAVMDIHWYQFGRARPENYFKKVDNRIESLRRFGRQQPVVIGEWSGMLSHLTLSTIPKDMHAALQREHIERQLRAYENADGWFYWSYKMEGRGIWNFRSLVESGEISLK